MFVLPLMPRRYSAVLLLLIWSGPLAAQSAEPQFAVSVDKVMMGTLVQTTVRHADIRVCKAALYAAYQEMDRVETLLSMQKPESEVSNINRNAGVLPVRVGPETLGIIQRAAAYSQQLEGLFDITVGPLSELWGFNFDKKVVLPKREEIAALLPLVDYRNIVVNVQDSTVFLTQPGMEIDLGGIAKGFAIDEGVAVLKRYGIQNFFLNAGGDIYLSGQKDANTDWTVGIQHPRVSNTLIATFHLHDGAVGTSGDYERYAVIDGTRYHHILDPRTGYSGNLCQSTTVIAPTAEEATVLSKYLFLKGFSPALQTPEGRQFLIVDADGLIHCSPAFAQITDVQLIHQAAPPERIERP